MEVATELTWWGLHVYKQYGCSDPGSDGDCDEPCQTGLMSAIVRWPLVRAMGRPSHPRAFGLSALFVPPLPLRHGRGHPAGEPCAFPAHKRLARK